MYPAVIADLILLLHLMFVFFVVFGGLLVLYRRWIAWIHIPMVLWASTVNAVGWICPLTPLENHFRAVAGEAGYSGGFVEHYLAPLVYPPGMTYHTGVAVGIAALVWNLLIYAVVFYRRRG